DPRPDAPEERQLVDGYVQHPVVHDLLDLVEQSLALLSIQLAGLPLEAVLDLRDHARRVDAVLAHVDLDARRRVAGGRAEAHDDAPELVLAPRREKGRALQRAHARADPDRLEIIADCFGEREERG